MGADMMMFLGRPMEFWLSLSEFVDRNLDVERLLTENIHLRAKVSYFEEQVKNATKFISAADQLKS